MKENPNNLNKLRVFFAIIYFLISLIIIYFFKNKMFYFKVPENSWNYYRLLWCCSASALGFSAIAFILRNHEKSPLPEYLTHYPFQLLAIATLVFSLLHIFDATSGYLFYYLSFSLCFTFSFLVDNYRGFIKSIINGFSK